MIRAIIIGLILGAVLHGAAKAQNVPCWAVPNGVNSTVQCQNGFWITTTPEGETFTGNGMTDPSASASGSTIVINPATGGPYVGAGTTVTPPTQVLPMLEPHQAQSYGFQPRQD